MIKEIVNTKDAPAAVGPYSQAIKANGLIFVSGQLPIEPSTGKFVGDTVTEQTRQCLVNIENILRAKGSSLEQVVKASVFLKDMNDFDEMNQVYGSHFSGGFPARACVEVARLPRDAKVEIEVIALCPN
jgi:2-iminobutanoate/2-iminopropanoate deaminase